MNISNPLPTGVIASEAKQSSARSVSNSKNWIAAALKGLAMTPVDGFRLRTFYPVIAAMALLTACDSSHRPTYSGHEESTEGVPGFVKGKKVSPHVKLGQSYTVDGETYVPRNQPDYVEEGMASWYGPGFHGGKTANGEKFDSDELTGAHRTLPLPSIVKVTMLSNGKQVYVRINDRGPFAHSRILDLSRGAAEKIGLVRAGVAKVRIEYMKNESERFAELLGQGRDPKSIDMASEIINYQPNGSESTQYARADTRAPDMVASDSNEVVDANNGSFWDKVSPVSNANAAPVNPQATQEAAPVSDVVAADLPQPVAAPAPAPVRAPAAMQAKAPVVMKAPIKAASAPTVTAAAAPAAPAPVPVRSASAMRTAAQSMEEEQDTEFGGPQESPFAMMDSGAGNPSSAPAQAQAPMQVASIATANQAPAAAPTGAMYVQLGAFQNQANAEKLRKQFAQVADLKVVPKQNASGMTLYHVRMGPYATPEASTQALDSAKQAGADAKIIRE